MSETTSTQGRVFTEGEAYALVQDNVARETAAANEKIGQLEKAHAELQTKVDVLETEKALELKRADEAVKELADFKKDLEEKEAREKARAERVVKLAEANPLLEITDERSDRIAAMSDEAFDAYLADMREVAAKSAPANDGDADDKDSKDKAAAAKKKKADMPRATAAFAPDPDNSKPTGTVLGVMGARRALSA